MTQNTKIEWADHTFNPWWGCTKISPACDNCYAAALDKRTGGDHWGANQPRKRTSAKNWLEPVKWNKQADAFFAEHGRRQRVFCASMADVFDNAVDPQWRADLFALIAATPNLDWLILTKRIGNATNMVAKGQWFPSHWPNVWLGATICNQEEADRDIPKLLAVPAAKRFLSIEPMLGPVNLSAHNDWLGRSEGGMWCPDCPERGVGIDPAEHHDCLGEVENAAPYIGIDWVICGGESGHGARPMHPDWARSLRDQCDRACVPFLFKQWGEWHPKIWQEGGDIVVGADTRVMTEIEGREMVRIGKKAAGRELDGMEHDGTPS
jgi:protein gp37